MKPTYKPLAPICRDCKWARLKELPEETFASAYCEHPEMSDGFMAPNIEQGPTDYDGGCQFKERR